MQRLGDAEEFTAAGRKLVRVGDREVTVFAVDGTWHAYENRCPHAGGPVCQGRVMPRVEMDVGPRGEVGEPRFSEDEFHLVCPWHGWEFDLRSGVSVSDPRRRLRRFHVEEREDGLYVSA
ncbi:MAG: Rieske (2Fe-2S) protein [Solirubrobacteraceae bacterium]